MEGESIALKLAHFDPLVSGIHARIHSLPVQATRRFTPVVGLEKLKNSRPINAIRPLRLVAIPPMPGTFLQVHTRCCACCRQGVDHRLRFGHRHIVIGGAMHDVGRYLCQVL